MEARPRAGSRTGRWRAAAATADTASAAAMAASAVTAIASAAVTSAAAVVESMIELPDMTAGCRPGGGTRPAVEGRDQSSLKMAHAGQGNVPQKLKSDLTQFSNHVACCLGLGSEKLHRNQVHQRKKDGRRIDFIHRLVGIHESAEDNVLIGLSR